MLLRCSLLAALHLVQPAELQLGPRPAALMPVARIDHGGGEGFVSTSQRGVGHAVEIGGLGAVLIGATLVIWAQTGCNVSSSQCGTRGSASSTRTITVIGATAIEIGAVLGLVGFGLVRSAPPPESVISSSEP
jgi:hypothetical protein